LGNPPFLGNRKLKANYGSEFLEWLKQSFKPCGIVDLVTYFFRRNYSIIKKGGFISLISTNTIAEGEARESGLDVIINSGGEIVFAIKSTPWPGVAQVIVSLISIFKGKWQNAKYLSNNSVDFINSYLSPSANESPQVIISNIDTCYQGSLLLGNGFIISNELAKKLIKEPNHDKVIKQYIDGDDLNNNYDSSPSRWVINFHNYEEKYCLENFPLAYKILEGLVKPSRIKNNPNDKWWIYWRSRTELYNKLKHLNRAITLARVSKYQYFTMTSVDLVFHEKVCVIANSNFSLFTVLNSVFHFEWCRAYGTTIGDSGLNYSPEKCYENFPLSIISGHHELQLESIGEAYHEHRRQLMLGMQLGLTKTYNLFHSNSIAAQAVNEKDKQVAALQKHLEKIPNTISFNEAIQGILKLRELHVQMDEAVLDAYGWRFDTAQQRDIALRHDFYEVDYLPENDRVRFTIHPDARKEILKRLLELNHRIFEQEAREGLHKEETVRKFYEQKGIPVPEEVSKWFKKGKTYKTKKANAPKVEEDLEGYGDLFGL
jgi:hypothetical protein